MYDRKVVAAATASGTLFLFAVLALMWRLILGSQGVGLL